MPQSDYCQYQNLMNYFKKEPYINILILQENHPLFKAHAGALRYQLLLNSTQLSVEPISAISTLAWITCKKLHQDCIDTKYPMHILSMYN